MVVTLGLCASALANDMTVTQKDHAKRVFINIKEEPAMKHQGVSAQEAKWYDEHLKHWRSWGSWFSWGSPVGLGLFFISVCFCIWLLGQTFGWK